MDRKEAISHIASLYPVDSDYEPTAKIGKELLEQAETEIAGWRTKPTEVLVRYAELCIARERKDNKM